MATQSAVLGYPRVGPHRELKKAVERFWAGKSSEQEVLDTAKALRRANWEDQRAQGVDVLPSNDFSLYDHVMDHSLLFGAVPARYTGLGLTPLETYFAMGRGLQRPAADGKPAVDVGSMEMVKWFDSNYHIFRPEIGPETQFTVSSEPGACKPVDEFLEAKALGIATRPVLLGPVTFLRQAKASAAGGPAPLEALPRLLDAYAGLLARLADAGADWVQMDEPVLVLDLSAAEREAFRTAYARLASGPCRLLVASYFGGLEDNWPLALELPVAGLHVDLVAAPGQLDAERLAALAADGDRRVLSLGLVSGRNVWRTDLDAALRRAGPALAALGPARIQLATSSSLLHTPVTLASETQLPAEVAAWFAFAREKCREVAALARALGDGGAAPSDGLFAESRAALRARRGSARTTDAAVRERQAGVRPGHLQRAAPFAQRKREQQEALRLPLLPTTTIGSFPQTKEIRLARSKFVKGELSEAEYARFIEGQIREAVDIQQAIGLDVLVHGEPERNDMVQYFGEQLSGFVFTQNGWVQSYGSRCVRPPIIVGDISRPAPMTVKEAKFAQSLTATPVKGMLTGPITMLRWSFPRDDLSLADQAQQLALALRDEVNDLEAAGIRLVQVDEPALREGLPLRKRDWDAYLEWAVNSFRLATSGVANTTSCHSHFCYSDFNEIFEAIGRLDADVISIESSKSDLKLLQGGIISNYPNEIGPGVYDIHSPRVPSVEEMVARLNAILGSQVDPKALWVNPDCGLKTRGWSETKQALTNMVSAARQVRERLAASPA